MQNACAAFHLTAQQTSRSFAFMMMKHRHIQHLSVWVEDCTTAYRLFDTPHQWKRYLVTRNMPQLDSDPCLIVNNRVDYLGSDAHVSLNCRLFGHHNEQAGKLSIDTCRLHVTLGVYTGAEVNTHLLGRHGKHTACVPRDSVSNEQ